MNLLATLLAKRGISKETDLSPEEKAVFDNYRVILSGEVVTVEKLKEFCKTQIRTIEGIFAGPETKNDVYLKASLHVYLNLLKAIEAPEAEREALERHLTQLIHS